MLILVNINQVTIDAPARQRRQRHDRTVTPAATRPDDGGAGEMTHERHEQRRARRATKSAEARSTRHGKLYR
jgi:hypothetical protein